MKTNRFKRLDLEDRVSEETGAELYNTVQRVVIKTIPNKNKCKKAKWLPEKALQNNWEKKGSETQGRRESYSQ